MLRKSAREDPTFGTRVFVTSMDRADTRRTLDSESEQQRCRHVAWAFGLHMTRRQVILWSRVVQRDTPILSGASGRHPGNLPLLDGSSYGLKT
jgi:hypothetical protein